MKKREGENRERKSFYFYSKKWKNELKICFRMLQALI